MAGVGRIHVIITTDMLVPTGSPSRGGDVAVYVFDIYQPSLPAPLNSVLVSISVFMALSTVFHAINSPDGSPLSHFVLPVLFLPCWFFQLKISLWWAPSALIESFVVDWAKAPTNCLFFSFAAVVMSFMHTATTHLYTRIRGVSATTAIPNPKVCTEWPDHIPNSDLRPATSCLLIGQSSLFGVCDVHGQDQVCLWRSLPLY